jgi:hypothetical protein
MKKSPERLARLQEKFAAHIRDPDRQAAPTGIENRRMQIYRRLFFNNISSLLAGNFPVLRSLYDEKGWQRLARDFYAEHRCQTPLFPEIAKEFLRYLQDSRGTREGDPPFMLELAHYEWVELALSIDEREPADIAADPGGDLLEGRPVLSPLAWPLSYRFPVHRIGKAFRPDEAPDEPTHLLVYRDRTDEVRFMQLNDVTRLLIGLMGDEPDADGRTLLLRVAEAIGHPRPEKVVQSGAAVLQDLLERGVILGTRISEPAP